MSDELARLREAIDRNDDRLLELLNERAKLARAVGLVDPTSAQCMQCHTDSAPSIKPFDFDTMWAKINHGKAAREAWLKARK